LINNTCFFLNPFLHELLCTFSELPIVEAKLLCHCILSNSAFVNSPYWKNPSPTLARDSVKIKYISGGQLSSYELAFEVESCPNSPFKVVSEPILDPLNRPHTKPKSVGREGVYWEKSKSHIG